MAKRSKKNNIIRISIFLIIAIICGLSFIWQVQLEEKINSLFNPKIETDVDTCELRAHFIDVGQGDAILFELPDDKIMLIDSADQSGEDELLTYLESIFATREDRVIHYFILTHKDEDHIGGADVVFDNFEIINFYRPNVYTPAENSEMGGNLDTDNICDTAVFKNTIAKMEAESCNVVVINEQVVETGNLPFFDETSGCDIKLFSPTESTYNKANNYSPVMMVTYMERKIMLTGDAEKQVENAVVDLYSKSELKADILKLGHHGSDTSTTQGFLDAVSPTYAVICVGEDNSYDHPNDDVMKRVVSKIGEHNIYRTDKDSNIIFGIDKDEVTSGKGALKLAFNGEVHVPEYVEWWYIVVIVLGASFVIIVLPKKGQKRVAKQLKKSKKK